ncbi:hypothetical protein KIL84_011045 [Mauremys mutica]|uniref:Uncharacterized protein n=1 Tax=Mauremys mutica TaxID=74926 RepID=A0A9D4B0M6_9SAUR|nr:hypothetical protein KIL84_011045 [Mauremys mutica]
MAMGLWTVLDPLAVFVVDAFLGRLTYRAEKPIADAAKLYWLFSRTEQSGIPGALITVMLYTILFIISSTVLSLYFLRLHNEGWLLDVFKRTHSDEGTFFVPLDLEISNQELSYIMKKAEQWRGINGERRKVAVYDYIWKDNTSKSGVSSCDLQRQDEISECEAHSGEITVHVSIYTVHLSGFQDLYRHFLRLPDGAIVEPMAEQRKEQSNRSTWELSKSKPTWSSIGGSNKQKADEISPLWAPGIIGVSLLYDEVSTTIQEHVSEMDNVLGASSVIKRRERKKNTARWKDLLDNGHWGVQGEMALTRDVPAGHQKGLEDRTKCGDFTNFYKSASSHCEDSQYTGLRRCLPSKGRDVLPQLIFLSKNPKYKYLIDLVVHMQN